MNSVCFVILLVVRLKAELVDLSHTLDENARNWPIKGFKRYNHPTLTVCMLSYILIIIFSLLIMIFKPFKQNFLHSEALISLITIMII